MTHPDVEAQVDAYLDGELAAMETVELEAHLAGCASCGRFRDDRLALRMAIAAELPRLEAPEALRGRVRAAVRQAAAPSRARRPAPAMACAGWHSPRRSPSSRSAAGASRRSTPPRRS